MAQPLNDQALAETLRGLEDSLTFELPPELTSFCGRRPELGLCGSCALRDHDRRFAELVRCGDAQPMQPVDGLPLKRDPSLLWLFLLCFHETTTNQCYGRAETLATLWLHYGITNDCWVMTGTIKFYNSSCRPIMRGSAPANAVHHSWVERCIDGEIWCYDTTNCHRMRQAVYYAIYQITDAQIEMSQDFLQKQLTRLRQQTRHEMVADWLGIILAGLELADFPMGALYGRLGWEVFCATLDYLDSGPVQRRVFLSPDHQALYGEILALQTEVDSRTEVTYRRFFSVIYCQTIEEAVRAKLSAQKGSA